MAEPAYVGPAVAPAGELSAAQRDRRRRILDAAIGLASGGGFEAVQMREVADRAGVALGTLYRYFPSKTHLLVAVTAQQFADLRARIQVRAPAEGTPAGRVLGSLEALVRALQRDRNLTDAMVRALMSADASVAAETSAVSRLMESIVATALHGDSPPAGASEAQVAAVLGKVLVTDVVAWLGGRIPASGVLNGVAEAVSLLLPEGCGRESVSQSTDGRRSDP